MPLHEHALGDKLWVYSRSDKPLEKRTKDDGTPRALILICHGLFYVSAQSTFADQGYFDQIKAPGFAVKYCQKHGKDTSVDEFEKALADIASKGLGVVNQHFPYTDENGLVYDYALGKGHAPGDTKVPFRGGKEHKNDGSYEWIGKNYVEKLMDKYPKLGDHADMARVRKSCNYFTHVLQAMSAANAYEQLLCGFCREYMVVG